jgi:hypothetical protein
MAKQIYVLILILFGGELVLTFLWQVSCYIVVVPLMCVKSVIQIACSGVEITTYRCLKALGMISERISATLRVGLPAVAQRKGGKIVR